MGDSISALARDLRGFDADAEVAKALKKQLAKGAIPVRRKIKASALATLPGGGGLNAWVAAGRISVRTTLTSRTVKVILRMGRSSINKKQSDFNAIDRGRVRHPSWGRRWAGQWHNQAVHPKFFSTPAGNTSDWAKSIDSAVDEALAVIGRG